MAFTVASNSFKDGDYLPKDFILSADFGFGCAGGNRSPHLKWSDAPAGTNSFAITCYDPGYEPHSRLPQGKFDGVLCTDVLEHCPQDDLEWIVGELFGDPHFTTQASLRDQASQAGLSWDEHSGNWFAYFARLRPSG